MNTNRIKNKTYDAMIGENIKSTKFGKRATLEEIVDIIRKGGVSPLIEKIRAIADDKERGEAKKKLKFFTLGISKQMSRKTDSFIKSQYILLDFDHVSNTANLHKKKEEIASDPETCVCFISPSGDGLKVIYKMTEPITDKTEFTSIYKKIASIRSKKYGIQADHTSDCLRACYFSADEDLYYNPGSDLLDISKFSLPEVSLKKEPAKLGSSRSRSSTSRGKRTRGKAATRNNSKGKNKGEETTKGDESSKSLIERIIDFLVQYKISFFEWICIGFFLCGCSNGRKLFVKLTANNPNFDDSEDDGNAKFDNLMASYDPISYPPSIHRLLIIARKYGFSNPFFYSIDEETGACYIDHRQFYLEFLPSIGIYYYKERLVRLHENIISDISMKDFKKTVIDQINLLSISNSDKRSLINKIISGDSYLYTDGKLSYINELVIEVMKDERDKVNLFFTNCWVEVTKDDIKINALADLPFPIMETQIIKREYKETDLDPNFSFNIFMKNITSDYINDEWIENEDKLASLRTAIGYLINNYKDPSNAKAVLFIDELSEWNLDSESNGGTGKSLLSKAVSKLVNHVNISGKKQVTGDKFAMQLVKNNTKLIIIDDLIKKYDFESLYTSITGDLEIERKGATPFVIPFSESPKILLSSNRVVGNDDDSTKRRKHEVEFSHYYNLDRLPKHDFSELFFDDWDSSSWNKFYRLMIACVQQFLTTGLVTPEISSYYRIMIANTNRSFIEYCESLNLDQEYNKTDELNRFKHEFPANANMSSIRFKQYLDFFAVAKGWRANHRASNGKSLVEFTERTDRASRRVPATTPITSTSEILIDQALEN